jgi:hypothetical protein
MTTPSEKGTTSSEKEAFIGERVELETVMQKLEGQWARNGSRITQWIKMIEELYQEVDIIKQVAQQGPRQPCRSSSAQQPAGRGKIAFDPSRPVNNARLRRP